MCLRELTMVVIMNYFVMHSKGPNKKRIGDQIQVYKYYKHPSKFNIINGSTSHSEHFTYIWFTTYLPRHGWSFVRYNSSNCFCGTMDIPFNVAIELVVLYEIILSIPFIAEWEAINQN